MVERVRSRAKKNRGGGYRENGGRPKGVPNKFNQRAVREAKRRGMLPHELLHAWALTGRMTNGHKKTVDLDVKDIIDCAKAAAPYYGQKLAPRQVGDQPQVTRLELDVAKLAGVPVDMLQMFREILLMLQKGGVGGMSELQVPGRADPSRFAAGLRPDTETEGRA